MHKPPLGTGGEGNVESRESTGRILQSLAVRRPLPGSGSWVVVMIPLLPRRKSRCAGGYPLQEVLERTATPAGRPWPPGRALPI